MDNEQAKHLRPQVQKSDSSPLQQQVPSANSSASSTAIASSLSRHQSTRPLHSRQPDASVAQTPETPSESQAPTQEVSRRKRASSTTSKPISPSFCVTGPEPRPPATPVKQRKQTEQTRFRSCCSTIWIWFITGLLIRYARIRQALANMADAGTGSSSTATTSTSALASSLDSLHVKGATKPKVVVIGLQDFSFVDSKMYERLCGVLLSHATVKWCENTSDCFKHIKPEDPPHAILVVDAGIVKDREVKTLCAVYMRTGGRLVFAADFASYMPGGENVRRFFQTFGVFWNFDGGERRNVVAEKVEAVAAQSQSNGDGGPRQVAWDLVPDQITFDKAHVLGNVKREDAPFVVASAQRKSTGRTEGDQTHNEGESSHGTTRVETPIAWSKQSLGSIGVICDYHAQTETDGLILALAGLL